MEKQTVTRKDVAQRAGVSVSVVSRALNNSGYVQADKKKRVIEIAEAMGYFPHPVAMSLQKRRTRQLLFFCKDLMNSYNIQMYQGMTRIARERGYMVVLNGNMEFSTIRETMVDGIIMPNEVVTEYYLQTIGKNYHLPVVTTFYGSPVYFPKSVPVVESDMHQVMAMAVNGLRKKGHRRIALAVPYDYDATDARIAQWRGMTEEALGKRQLEFLISCSRKYLQKEQELLEMLNQSESFMEGPDLLRRENFFIKGEILARIFVKKDIDATAVICFNDELAAGFCSELRRMGIMVPEKVSVMGIDGSYIRQITRPRLSTVSIDPEQQGEKCAEVLIDLIEGKRIHYVTRVPMKLLEGETVKEISGGYLCQKKKKCKQKMK